MRPRNGKSNDYGFTLVELLVVISVIGVLSSVVLVNMGGMRQSATIAQSKTFMSSIQQKIGIDIAGAWDLNDGSGATAKDSSGMNNNGTLVNAPAWEAAENCVLKGCLNFDGASRYVTIPNSPYFKPDTTVSLWIKPATYGADTYGSQLVSLMDGCVGANGGYMFGLRPTGSVVVISGSNSVNPGDWNVSLGNGGKVNYWINLVFVWEATGASTSSQYIYADGKQVGKRNLAIAVPSQLTSVLNVGRFTQCWPARYYSGLMDDIQIYNAALSIAAVRERYLAGLKGLLATGQIAKTEYGERISQSNKEYAVMEQKAK